MATATKINVAGVWKTPSSIKINVAGVWKSPSSIKANVAGVWKTVFPGGPSVSLASNGDFNFRSVGTCYGGLQINSNGIEYEYTNTGGTTSLGNWLDSGLNSEVWILMTLISGTWNSLNAGTTRLQCSTTRSWRISRSSAGTHTVTARFRAYDAASGGNLLSDTGNITFTVEQGTA